MRKKNKAIPFEKILERELHNQEIVLEFDQYKFYLHAARLINALRTKLDMTQAQLAKMAKVSQPLIARIEKGDQSRTPSLETLSKILLVLGYSIQLNIVSLKKMV